MRHDLLRLGLVLSLIGYCQVVWSMEPEKGPMPRVVGEILSPDYRTVDRAIPAKIKPATTERIAAGYLGVAIQLDDQGRILIDEIQPGSPAAKVGLQKGDWVVQVDGRDVSTPQVFREWIQSHMPGESLQMNLQRNGSTVEVTIPLAAVSRPMKVGNSSRVYLGLELADSSDGGEVFVERVSPGSPAAEAGLKNGDLVLKLEGRELPKAARLADMLENKKAGEALIFTIKRNDKSSDVKVVLASERTRFGGPTLWKKNTLKLAIIGIEFTDTKHNNKITPKALEDLLLSRGIYKEKSPTGQPVVGSLNDYLDEQSGGNFRLEGKAFAWVEVAKKRGDYIQGSGTSNKTALLVDALDKLTAREGKEVLNGFDACCFVYAGDRYRTNRGAIYSPHAGLFRYQGKNLSYMISFEGGSTLAPIGAYAKEIGLLMGLPELAARTENLGSEGLGPWCALSDVFPTNRPQNYCAWAKEKLGWLKPTVIDPTVKQKLVLSAMEGSSTECFKVLVRADGSEYFLLENRRKKGFDADLPGEGLLIWRVINDRPILEESHGIEGPSGPNAQKALVPYPSSANNSFTPDTTPSSRSPLGGGLPVHLTQIRKLIDGRVTFHIGYEYR